jgi:hypothetical protein
VMIGRSLEIKLFNTATLLRRCYVDRRCSARKSLFLQEVERLTGGLGFAAVTRLLP